MARQRFYMRYAGNAQRGVPEGKLEVYPGDAALVGSRLYIQNTPNGKLVRASDAEEFMARSIISQLQPEIDNATLLLEIMSTDQPGAEIPCRDAASIIGEDLLAYTLQLARGDIGAARQTIEKIGHKLMALVTTSSSPTNKDEVAIDTDKLFADTAQTLSLEIETGLRLYEQLEGNHSKLVALRREATRAAASWSLSDEDPAVKEHLDWLSHDKTGFCAQVSAFFAHPSLEQEDTMRQLCDNALEHFDALEATVASAEAARRHMCESAQPVLELATATGRLIRELQGVRDSTQKLPKETVDEVVSGSELLSIDELERWREYEINPLFGNFDRVKTESADLAEKIRRRIDDSVSLGEKAEAAIAEARRYLQRLQNRLSSIQPLPAPKMPKVTPQQTVPPQPKTPTDGQTRLDVIYDLVIGVASYKYCSPRHFVGTTVNSVLGILVLLGKITEQEKDKHRDELTKRLNSRSVVIEDNLKIHDAWKNTNPHHHDWIYIQPKPDGLWLWRLVERAKAPGQYLARQLGLTPEAVEAAFQEQKEAREEKARKFRNRTR